MAHCFLWAKRGISNIESTVEYWTAHRVSLVWPRGNFATAINSDQKKSEERGKSEVVSISPLDVWGVDGRFIASKCMEFSKPGKALYLATTLCVFLAEYQREEHLQCSSKCPDILCVLSEWMNVLNTALGQLQGSWVLVYFFFCLTLIR